MMTLPGIYLILINLVAFIVYGIDKGKARRHRKRIPESTLILLAIMGGSIGSWLAMYIFRHKTKHRKFTIGIPVILVVQVLLIGSFLIQS